MRGFYVIIFYMPPDQFSGMSHGAGTAGDQATQSRRAEADRADQIHKTQTRAHLENRLRIRKLDVNDRGRQVAEIEREITHINDQLHHSEMDIKRVEQEFHSLEILQKKDMGQTRVAEGGMREKEQELRRRGEDTLKLEHEIEVLKKEVEEKERKIAEIKEETRDATKKKEDFRRQYELEHFGAQTEGHHVHDKGLEIQRLRQERERKERELEHKTMELARLRKDIMFKEQEVLEIEGELKRL